MNKFITLTFALFLLANCKPTPGAGSSIFGVSTVTVSMAKSEAFEGGVFRVAGGNGSIVCDHSSKNTRCSDEFEKGATLTLTAPSEIKTVSGKNLVFNRAFSCSNSRGNIIGLRIDGNKATFNANENLTCSASYREAVIETVVGTINDPAVETPTTSTSATNTVTIKMQGQNYTGDPFIVSGDGSGGLILCDFRTKTECEDSFLKGSALDMTVPEFIEFAGTRLQFNGTIECTNNSGQKRTRNITGTKLRFEATESLTCSAKYDNVASTTVGSTDATGGDIPSVVITPKPEPTTAISTGNNTATIKFRDSDGNRIVAFEGFIRDSLGQINCSGGNTDCDGTYTIGTTVTFTASETLQVSGLSTLFFQDSWVCVNNAGRQTVGNSTDPSKNAITAVVTEDLVCGAIYNR